MKFAFRGGKADDPDPLIRLAQAAFLEVGEKAWKWLTVEHLYGKKNSGGFHLLDHRQVSDEVFNEKQPERMGVIAKRLDLDKYLGLSQMPSEEDLSERLMLIYGCNYLTQRHHLGLLGRQHLVVIKGDAVANPLQGFRLAPAYGIDNTDRLRLEHPVSLASLTPPSPPTPVPSLPAWISNYKESGSIGPHRRERECHTAKPYSRSHNK